MATTRKRHPKQREDTRGESQFKYKKTLEEAKHQGIGMIPKVKFSKNKIFYKLEHFSRDKQDHLKILDADFFRELQFA